MRKLIAATAIGGALVDATLLGAGAASATPSPLDQENLEKMICSYLWGYTTPSQDMMYRLELTGWQMGMDSDEYHSVLMHAITNRCPELHNPVMRALGS